MTTPLTAWGGGGAPPLSPSGAELRLVPGTVTSSTWGAELLPEETALDQEAVCRRVARETHDVVSVLLEPTGPVAFSPGQYLTVVADIDGTSVERCYTIASPPTRPHLLRLTVKRTPGGLMSPYLHDRLNPGDRLSIRGPLGGFTVRDHVADRYLLLSAGSGVTPTLSTLRTLADLADPTDVVVVHSARSEHDLVCRAEVEAIAASADAVRVHWVCEDRLGRLTPELLQALVPDVDQREVLTCGPPGYMQAAREVLTTCGAAPDRCHEESFVLGTPSAPTDLPGDPVPVQPELVQDVAEPSDHVATVRFARSDRVVACPPGTTVLDAARRAGVPLPSSCAEGLCGTCTSSLIGGEVQMDHQGGIRPRQIAQRQFLPCCSTPVGDIVVDA